MNNNLHFSVCSHPNLTGTNRKLFTELLFQLRNINTFILYLAGMASLISCIRCLWSQMHLLQQHLRTSLEHTPSSVQIQMCTRLEPFALLLHSQGLPDLVIFHWTRFSSWRTVQDALMRKYLWLYQLLGFQGTNLTNVGWVFSWMGKARLWSCDASLLGI